MGKRGRKPRNVQAVDGIDRAGVDAKPPIALSRVAMREWRRVLPLVTRTKVLAEQDLVTLAMYCAAVAGVVDCDAEIKRSGLMIAGRAGTQVRNPLLIVRATFAQQVLAFSKELGLTPNTRENARPIDSLDIENDPAARHFAHLRAVGV